MNKCAPYRELDCQLIPPHHREITPINVSMAKVLVAIQDKNLLKWPHPLKSGLKLYDLDKYFQFHQNHGHDTNNCFNLMNEIERLMKKDT